MTSTVTAATSGQPILREGVLVRIAIGFTSWAERWFPEAFSLRCRFFDQLSRPGM
jgi:H+/Cl- antiporter ClcA